ncbi:MAG: PucC family protein [Anaerolineae bacterium]
MFLKRIQLGLIHVAVAMTLVPINSTLNRVMIKELALSATLVAVLASLPYLFSPIQIAIGAYSDRHPILGYRRSPYILAGLLLCVLGVILSPYAAFLLSQDLGTGILLALLAFGAWGFSNALSRLIGTLLSGVLRDGVTQITGHALSGYLVVFSLEAAMLLIATRMLSRIDVEAFRRQAEELSFVEKVALAAEG